MKILFPRALASVSLFIAIFHAGAATLAPLPQEAVALHGRLAAKFPPSVRSWAALEATRISKNPNAGEANVRADIKARFAGQPVTSTDIEALVFITMTEITQEADKDLQAQMDEMQKLSEKKQAIRKQSSAIRSGTASSNAIDTAADLSESKSIRLQTTTSRRTKLVETLSNMTKKMSATQDTISGNLK